MLTVDLTTDLTNLRGLDDNTLLRAYDRTKDIRSSFASNELRTRAQRLLGRINRELARRRVRA